MLPIFRSDLVQGTEEWHAWRRGGIGASDAPILLGISPYKKPHKLWSEKVGLVSADQGWKYVFERGHKIEAAARAYFEILNDQECPPICVELDDHPYIRASLDGYNADGNFILEVKYVGKDAMGEEIPSHHFAQLQHQMLVTGATDVTYIRSNTGTEFKIDSVARDQAFIDSLLQSEVEFWRRVVEKDEPPVDVTIRKRRKSRG
jgi:putative phage-type endonuclease